MKALDQKPTSLERGTPTLDHVTAAFSGTGLFFDTFWSPFPPRKWNLRSVFERIRSIRYQKLKQTSSKARNIIFRSVGFADWFVGLKYILNSAKTTLKINSSKKTR